MRQLVQEVGSGALRIVEVPTPSAGPTEVLVATRRSLVSKGTERAVRQLASAGLLAKARARPDLVRRVVKTARTQGVVSTARTVRRRLREDMPLGYSGAGVVVEVGEFVEGVSVGQRVATGGAGHADFQVVQAPLAVPIPDAVSFDEAAFATVASVAIHGLRLADLGPGARICVIGLGLLGQLVVRVALAAGCDVAGIDLRSWNVDRAREAGAFASTEAGDDTTTAIVDWTKGRGVDAVLLTAATSSSEPIRRAPAILRDRAVVVVVGDIGLDLQRAPLYEKEITLRFARSYGPGRYDRSYEQWGVDYPIGHVRWTEGRNLESFLDLVNSGRLRVADLISRTLPFESATEAYDLIANDHENTLGIELEYAATHETKAPVGMRPRSGRGAGVGLIGAGSFAASTLVPAMKAAGFDNYVAVASARGTSASSLAVEAGFSRVASTARDVIHDPAVELVVVATRHDSHEELTVQALTAGKHVFCEKPLALSTEGLERVRTAWNESSGHLMVGFNRRYAPDIQAARRRLGKSGGPLVITYRINAGSLPRNHWYWDRRQGGRLLGEVCHFIDTCGYLVGHAVEVVTCVGSGRGEALLEQDLIVTLRYADGSVATISYASGGSAATPKERIEILGRGHSVVVDDFRALWIDGKKHRRASSDKGHAAELAFLRRTISSGANSKGMTMAAFDSMAATLAAAVSLLGGRTVTLGDAE